MVNAVELMISNYFSIPMMSFSDKIISGLSFLESIKSDFKGDDLKQLNKDIVFINNIISNTNNNLFINLFGIDRWINPNSGVNGGTSG